MRNLFRVAGVLDHVNLTRNIFVEHWYSLFIFLIEAH